ncbi:hypothetical protein ADL28_08840 [Streptomyces violaceusniger]|uniref:ATP/GTP-binding protein n=2 Tax=Streptomyces violaceusniger group TaxID=2839105 RepID=A0ABD5JI25_9ACTN|nr:hypothetical protein [Streptomyces violaceusniger]KUL64781.1 hypothetical protein ADL28_08840 [Streptomyces violaceusniger]MEE4588073.1 hypothetical protein [Streptomyces sp. DSM 41602]
MADDDPGNVITLPVINLNPPGDDPPASSGGLPTLPDTPPAVPPGQINLPSPDLDSDEDEDDPAPGMVARAADAGSPARGSASMAMVALAGIAVAALRGAWNVAAYLKARREHHQSVAEQARQDADKGRAKPGADAARWRGRVQSGPEFGRSAARGSAKPGAAPSRMASAAPAKPHHAAATHPKTSTKADGFKSRTPDGKRSADARREARRDAAVRGADRKPAGASSSAGAGKDPGTLGKMALARQARKNDDATAARQADADRRKADLADRVSARKQAEKDADAKRARKIAKDKARKPKNGKADDPKKQDKDTPPQPDQAKDDASKGDLATRPNDGKSKGGRPNGSGKPGPSSSHTPGGEPGSRPWKNRTKTKHTKRDTKKRRKARQALPTGGPRQSGSRGRKKGARGRQHPKDAPRSGGEWLRPPPGWKVGYSVTITRPDREKPAPQPAAITRGRLGLPAGTSTVATPTAGTTPGPSGPAAPQKGAPPMSAAPAVRTTQFTDAELTVYDVIDSDEDMAEEILAGAEHAKAVADRCEDLASALESLRAELIDKKVPGVLIGWMAKLIERAQVVQGKAEGLAAALPRASEAITSAGQRAAEADKHRADAVKDAGHVAPAEREYHQE